MELRKYNKRKRDNIIFTNISLFIIGVFKLS